jgi:hypothetical protein
VAALATPVAVEVRLHAWQQATANTRCELPQPAVLRTDGAAVLEMWELPAAPLWLSENLPDAPAYAAYRAAIDAAGANQIRPPVETRQPKDEADRELWRREDFNAELMYSGGGHVRRIHCLEAALFARQHARYSQLTHPTEFVAHILTRGDRLKVYFWGSDQPFPPRAGYGQDEARADVAAGWQFAVFLHNHTIRTLNGRPALGVPAPSTSDVQLSRSLTVNLGLREVWLTNGIYTGVVTAESLGRFSVR